jgi:hypothetical protein
VRLLDIASETETTLEAGCDPAFSNGGQRIAFATPPQEVAAGVTEQGIPTSTNAIRLVNRQGENGWDFVTAGGNEEDSGHLVYAPVWSPDDEHIVYNRFIGYQALVDINYVEWANSFEGEGELLQDGAGWLLPARFAPESSTFVIVDYNFSDARGWGGYEPWSLNVLEPGQQGEIILPRGTVQTEAQLEGEVLRTTSAAWAPEGGELAIVLPPNWSSDIPPMEPTFENRVPGDLRRWSVGETPGEVLVSNVDFASPVLWLPAP